MRPALTALHPTPVCPSLEDTPGVAATAAPWRRALAAVWVGWGVALALGLGGLASAQAQDQPQSLRTIALSAGMHRITAEVAQTPSERAIGLMHRREMPQHAGMLFVFERPDLQCFWMKNTLLPLSIAFLDDDGTVVNIADMKPQSLESHCSARPVRLVLEMNQGWFAKRGVGVGSRLTGAVFRSAQP